MSSYILIKYIHMATATLSICLFVLRCYWRWSAAERLQSFWVKFIPHANDTLLLLSAIVLALMIGQYPGVHAWLTAKILLLLLYIGLGLLALRFGKTAGLRLSASVAAVITFFCIVLIAHSKSVNPDTWLPALFN